VVQDCKPAALPELAVPTPEQYTQQWVVLLPCALLLTSCSCAQQSFLSPLHFGVLTHPAAVCPASPAACQLPSRPANANCQQLPSFQTSYYEEKYYKDPKYDYEYSSRYSYDKYGKYEDSYGYSKYGE
jgi:hypothetical protein